MERTNHACQTCGHIFDQEEELQEHLLIAHGIEDVDQQDSENPEDEDAVA